MKIATKPEVARATGLSVMTCGTILNELLVIAEVLELEIDPSSGGRPAIRYQYNADYIMLIMPKLPVCTLELREKIPS